MIAAFWICLTLIIYTYFGYPLLIWIWSMLKNQPVLQTDITPSVSIIIAAWNEEDVIERRLKNLLELTYPSEKIEILIGLDGCLDRTADLIREHSRPEIRVYEYDNRRGKTAVLNDLVSHARNSILLFTDCRQTFSPDALKQLVRNFADSHTGCVSGELIFTTAEGGTAKGVNLYWNYEKFLRACESRVHSMLGATGAIYAVRRELFKPLPENIVLDDMYTPLQIIGQGFRCLFERTARAFDRVADSPREETRRKVRTLYGNFQIFKLFPSLFYPFKSPVALQFFSHKFLRVMMPFLLIAAFFANIWIADRSGLYFFLLIAQLLFYFMAFVGGITRYADHGTGKLLKNLCYVPYVFCLLNFSALLGFVRYLLGEQSVMWDKARGF